MKIPSFETVVETFKLTISRYWLTLSVALIGWIATWFVIDKTYTPDSVEKILESIALMCVIALPLSIGLKFAFKAFNVKNVVQYVVSGFFFGLLVYFGFTYDRSVGFFNSFYSLAIAANLFAGLAMHLKSSDNDSFWRFNKTMLLRLVISGLFAVALGTGLSVAIGALQVLFKVDIQGEAYARLWSTMGWLFTTYIFLAGINPEIESYQEHEDYPKLLKVFSQFVLIPLSILYLVILYAYEIKILFEMTLPNGWVSGLIFAMAAVGILATLLLYPIREYNNYIKQYSKWLFYSIIPLIPLLFIALSIRIGEYGITEARYYGYVVACWLVGIMGYYIISRKKNIRAIPVTLAIIAVVLPLGPWSASNVSTKSQVNRFIELNNQYSNEKTDSLRKDVIQNMHDIYKYLDEKKDMNELVFNLKEYGLLKNDFPKTLDSVSFVELADSLHLDQSLLNLLYSDSKYYNNRKVMFQFDKDEQGVVDVEDYKYMAHFDLQNNSIDSKKSKTYGNSHIQTKQIGDMQFNHIIDNDTLEFDLTYYIFAWYSSQRDRELNIYDMTIQKESATHKVLMIVEEAEVSYNSGVNRIEKISFNLFWKKK